MTPNWKYDLRVRVAIAVLVATLLGATGSPAATLQPPVIHEPFTVLPCPKHASSTLAIEGCQERALLSSDLAINALTSRIFNHLRPTFRAGFVRGEIAWLAYRRRTCTAQASPEAGGTANGIEFLGCELQRNKTHLTDLHQLVQAVLVH
jgi:uncharacterized protein YecT (DUF1311 family)